MKHGTQRIHSLNIVLKQVNKTTAKKLFNQGEEIFLHPCNMRLNNMWQNPIAINKNYSNNSFDTLVNSFEIYNCVSELGKYANFFINLTRK